MSLPAAEPSTSRDHVGGLAKGLRLIEAFDAAHVRLTCSEAARRTGMTPAAARRGLLTLCELGYADTDGKHFRLTHGTLRLAYAYTASTRLPRLLQPALDALSERTRESASLSVLHQGEVRVAARSTARRSLTVGLGVGSRLPLHCSASGRVLLAALSNEEIERGVRSIAVPLQDAQGVLVGARAWSSRADRMTAREMVEDLLPAMRRTQLRVGEQLQ